MIWISAAGQTGGERCDTPAEMEGLNAALEAAAARHVTVVAASGDIGAVGEPSQVIKGLTGGTFPPVKEVNLPAADPLVLATGGTSLNASHTTGTYISETAWGLPSAAPERSSRPRAAGSAAASPGPATRTACPASPPAAASRRVRRGLTAHGHGTRHQRRRQPIHDPQQRRHQRQRTTLGRPDRPGRPVRRPSPRFVNPAIYRIGASASYHEAVHDITTGNNTPAFPGHTINGYTATPGWDPITGWGSPNAQR